MDISTLTPELIDAMDADQMRQTLKSEYVRIQTEKADRQNAEQEEEALKAEASKNLDDFFKRKFASNKMYD